MLRAHGTPGARARSGIVVSVSATATTCPKCTLQAASDCCARWSRCGRVGRFLSATSTARAPLPSLLALSRRVWGVEEMLPVHASSAPCHAAQPGVLQSLARIEVARSMVLRAVLQPPYAHAHAHAHTGGCCGSRGVLCGTIGTKHRECASFSTMLYDFLSRVVWHRRYDTPAKGSCASPLPL